MQSNKVLASCYSGKIGCRDNNLEDGGYYFAELSKDYKARDYSALGNLKFGHKLKITYKGKSVIASKADKGAGGRNNPKIDLHETLAEALNFPYGLDYVEIENV